MKRILIRSPNWIGDQILAYPFYKELRRNYPDAWIAAVCTEWVKDVQFQGLVDEVFVIPKRQAGSWWSSFKIIRDFARAVKASGPWDLGITLPNSFGSALFLYLAGAVERRGYSADGRSFLLTQKLAWNPSHQIHRAHAYLQLLEPEGALPFEGQNYWKSGAEKQFDPIHYWPNAVALTPPKQPYIVIAPGATADSRRWTVDQFAEFIDRIQKQYAYRVVLVGGPAERKIGEELVARGLTIEDYIAKGSVSSLWRVFRESKFTICNESGLAHVAALCGSRVQIICGAADPRRTCPIGPGPVQVKVNPVSCWPCERNVCMFEDNRRNRCLVGIAPEQVVKEVEDGFINT